MNSWDDILVFDTEATGLIAGKDQIIELTLQWGQSEKRQQTWRIKPSVPISEDAFRVHGISMEMLQDSPSFEDLASEIHQHFSDSKVLVAYNIDFDLQMLQSEFRRVKMTEIDLSSKLLVDPLVVWRKSEPRDLQAAYKRFVGGEMENAHSSAADVAATAGVLEGMLGQFKLEGKSWEELAQFCGLSAKDWIGPSRHLKWEGDDVVIGFGKHRGRKLVELAEEDDGSYLRWILSKDFPDHVREVVQAALGSDSKGFSSWAEKNLR